MGWVMMSERELKRVEVLAQIDDGRLSVLNGANILELSERQLLRLLKRYRSDGASAIRHKAGVRQPNNRIHSSKRDYILGLVRDNFHDFGPTLAAEMLAEHHGVTVSRETLRKCLSCIQRMHCRVIDNRRRFVVIAQTTAHLPSAQTAP